MKLTEKFLLRRQHGMRRLLAIGLLLALFGAASTIISVPLVSAAPMPTVSAGHTHTCAINANGTVSCWGSNFNGESTPPSGVFVQVSAGYGFSCGIKANYTVVCWGDDLDHQVSNAPSGTFVQVSAGGSHACAIGTDHQITCWGSDNANQISDAPSGTFIQVGAGYFHTCAVSTSGSVSCWGGLNTYGELNAPGGTFTQVGAGISHSCGLHTDGSIACWGRDIYNLITDVPSGTFTQLGVGNYHVCGVHSDGSVECWGHSNGGLTDAPSGAFTQVTAGGNQSCGIQANGAMNCWGQSTAQSGRFSRVQADAGSYHVCGVRGDGTVGCWGDTSDGKATPPSGTFLQVTAGYAHSCGIKTDGTVTCWGDNSEGQLNSVPSGTFSQISAGIYNTCGIHTNGTLACWGDSTRHQTDNQPSGTFVQVSLGAYHGCAIRTNGDLACWGQSSVHQFDNLPSGTFSQVSGGAFHSCAIRTNGNLVCWGDTASSQMSNIPSGTFVQVDAGYYHTCAVKTDGTVACWGNSGSNALDNVPSSSFTFIRVSAGGYFTCGVQTSNVVICWGSNSNGQLGEAADITSSAPPSLATDSGTYSHTYTATGVPTPTFSVTSGSLPNGLLLNSTSGLLSGTPTVEGVFSGTVTASNGFFASDSQSFSITADIFPPTTSASAKNANNSTYTFGTWTNQSVTVTLLAVDSGSGVDSTYFKIDGGLQTTYTVPFSVTGEADHTVEYWSVDNVAHEETHHTVHVKIDLTGPSLSSSASPSPNGNGWNNSAVTISWTCIDPLSGVASCPPDHTFVGQGTNQTTTGTAFDNVGNSTTVESSPGVNIDLIKPDTAISAKNADTTGYIFGNWTKQFVVITLTANDLGGSGIASIFYQIDADPQQTYSTPFTISTEGSHSLSYWSVDKADNAESSHSVTIKIDLTAPSISGDPTTAPNGNNGWYTSAVTIHWTCNDSPSGIAVCPANQLLGVDGSSVSTNGTAIDVAGNSTTVASTAVMIDRTPPVITYAGNQGTYTIDQTVNITCTASDATSGLASSTCQDVSAPASSFVYGINFVNATATDNAGNVGNGSASFTIVAPTSTPRASFLAFSSGQVNILAYIVTGGASARPAGFLSYSDGNVSLSNVKLLSLIVNGTTSTIYGTAKLGDGTPVSFTLVANETLPTAGIRLQLSNGYDSGNLPVRFLRVTP